MEYLVTDFQPTDPLQQGDVLRHIDDPHIYGIVVTADCDLLHRKHGDELTIMLG